MEKSKKVVAYLTKGKLEVFAKGKDQLKSKGNPKVGKRRIINRNCLGKRI